MLNQVFLHANVRGTAIDDVQSGESVVGTSALVPCTVVEDHRSVASVGLGRLGMAHDLANLLQVAASAVELIDRGIDRVPPSEMRRLSRAALRTIHRAGKLGREILDVSAAPSSSAHVLDLGSVLDGMSEAILLAAGTSVGVEFVATDSLPVVFCDPQEFESMVLNLVVNARDASHEGGTISISLGTDLRGRSETENLAYVQVVLCVADTGCGMTDAMVRDAFQPFFTTKPADRGTGLGLAIVEEFARRYDGSVRIESEPRKGTRVYVSLPAYAR